MRWCPIVVSFAVPSGTCTTRYRSGARPAMAAEGSRARLLEAAMTHVAAHGVGEISLRGLAAALGTSHRMLIYHFGSREGLLIEVIRTVEAQQRAALEQMLAETDAPPEET